jgi:hypothetical protein
MGTTTSAAGITTAEAAVGATPGSATGGEPQTPEGVPEDVLEVSEEEPEVALELVPVLEVVVEEVPAEGAMITVRSGSFPIPRYTSAALTGAPHSCYRGRYVQCGTGGGPGASHPLCVG